MSTAYKPGQLSALFGVLPSKTVISQKRKLPAFDEKIFFPSPMPKKQRIRNITHQPSITKNTNEKRNKMKNKHQRMRKNRSTIDKQSSMNRKSMDARTIFLGNIPIHWKERNVKQFLQKWKKNIECVTFSNYISKIKEKKLQMHRNPVMSNIEKVNKNCWIRMNDEKCAHSALILNNTLLNEEINGMMTSFTVRVDMSDSKCNNSLTLFLGNLPLSATEDMIRSHFVGHECTNILNVRIIRDKLTQISKKCGFIEFSDVKSYANALDLNGTAFGGKKDQVRLRVMPWMMEAQQMKEDFMDNQRNHLKKALSTKPNKLRTKSGMVYAFAHSNKNQFAKDEKFVRLLKEIGDYSSNSRTRKVKKRWRDHPEMRLECELRKKRNSVQRTLKRNVKGLHVNFNEMLGRDFNASKKNAKLERLKLELKTQTIIAEQVEHRKQVKQKKWRAKQRKIKHIIDNKNERKSRKRMKSEIKKRKQLVKQERNKNSWKIKQMDIDPKMFDDPAYN